MMSSLSVGDTGYHLRSQLALGPVRRRPCPLCQRSRFVSFVSIKIDRRILFVIVYWLTSLFHASSGRECFDIHLGKPQKANLGDGHGWLDQRIELRKDYGNPDIGSCWESLVGGNHFRMFRQNGPNANTGALFLA
jgi:hypothetical protein